MLQNRTWSQLFDHLVRQANRRPHFAQIFVGVDAIPALSKYLEEQRRVAEGVAYVSMSRARQRLGALGTVLHPVGLHRRNRRLRNPSPPRATADLASNVRLDPVCDALHRRTADDHLVNQESLGVVGGSAKRKAVEL